MKVSNHYKMINSKVFLTLLTLLIVMSRVLMESSNVYAKDKTISVSGELYEFEEKSNYDFSSSEISVASGGESIIGELEVTGNLKEDGNKGGFPGYSVSSGKVMFSYKFDSSILKAEETEWHLIEDKSKKIDKYSTEKNILNGAVLVQSSKDGENWITDFEQTDAFKTADVLKDSIYTTKDVQLENGCYYRIIVAYKLQIKTGEEAGWFGRKKDTQDTKKVAEVYSFYLANTAVAGSTSNASVTPRKELIDKSINTGKDNGFSGNNAIDKDDPHFGWKLGTFVLNGFTSEATKDGKNYYLKNVGDKVTLWFTLNQDINCLNGNENLTISEDANAYDLEFGVKQSDFGHGTLIISFKDFEGHTQDPIIYNDFLAANATTGADTRVQLFEEGDYKVALDYEIKNNPRQVGPVSIVPTYTNYKMEFSFSIRNSNCMVYPFDENTGNELQDKGIAEGGFHLDMAKSRYLKINVKRSEINVADDGTISLDERFNRSAKDGEKYIDEGIYEFTVRNEYNELETTKTIYVGTDKYLRALSSNKLTIDELNNDIRNGYTISEDGSIAEIESQESEVPVVVEEIEQEQVEETKEVVTASTELANTDVETTKDVPNSTNEDAKITVSDSGNGNVMTYGIAAAAIAGVAVLGVLLKKNKKK